MWNVCHMFNIPYGVYSNQTFNKRKIKNSLLNKWKNFLYPNYPVRCITTGPSESGKSVILTNKNLNIINENDKIYIYSPSPHQDLFQKLITRFNNSIPINIIPNILNEKNIDVVIEEIVNKKISKNLIQK